MKFTAVSVNVDILLQKGLEHIQAALNDTSDINKYAQNIIIHATKICIHAIQNK